MLALEQIRVDLAVDLRLARELSEPELCAGHGLEFLLVLSDHPTERAQALLRAAQPVRDVVANHVELGLDLRALLTYVGRGRVVLLLERSQLLSRLGQRRSEVGQHRVGAFAHQKRLDLCVRLLERALQVGERCHLEARRNALLLVLADLLDIALASLSSTTTLDLLRYSAIFFPAVSSASRITPSWLDTNASAAVASSVFQDWCSSR